MQNFILFGILLTLLKKEKVTAKELADKFEISQRSIHRYLNALCDSGVPIFTLPGRNGGISLMNGYKFDSNFFTVEEKSFICSTLNGKENDARIVKQILNKLS